MNQAAVHGYPPRYLASKKESKSQSYPIIPRSHPSTDTGYAQKQQYVRSFPNGNYEILDFYTKPIRTQTKQREKQ